jgi:uncharacterized protein (TIGR03086 family)
MTVRPLPLDLLTRAVETISRSLDDASTVSPSSPTPCTEWDLGTLVHHVADSAATLSELIEGSPPGKPTAGGCAEARRELRRLLEVVRGAARDCPAIDLVALTGTFELTIHAWDIDRATGSAASLAADLVSTLLSLAPVVLGDVQRTGLFADEAPPPGRYTDTDRLLALFGRRGETD